MWKEEEEEGCDGSLWCGCCGSNIDDALQRILSGGNPLLLLLLLLSPATTTTATITGSSGRRTVWRPSRVGPTAAAALVVRPVELLADGAAVARLLAAAADAELPGLALDAHAGRVVALVVDDAAFCKQWKWKEGKWADFKTVKLIICFITFTVN